MTSIPTTKLPQAPFRPVPLRPRADTHLTTLEFLAMYRLALNTWNELIETVKTLADDTASPAFRALSEGPRSLVTEPLGRIAEVCSQMGLRFTAKHAERIMARVHATKTELERTEELLEWMSEPSAPKAKNEPSPIALGNGSLNRWQEIIREVKELKQRMDDELDVIEMFVLDHRTAGFLSDPCLFGYGVSQRFPGVISDVEECGKCLAFERPTAAVFHLGRVLERCLHEVAPLLQVNLPADRQWGTFIDKMSKAVDALPTSTLAERDRGGGFHRFVNDLHHVRRAWRNNVMHPRQSYSLDEALEIFQSVKSLMSHAVSLQ